MIKKINIIFLTFFFFISFINASNANFQEELVNKYKTINKKWGTYPNINSIKSWILLINAKKICDYYDIKYTDLEKLVKVNKIDSDVFLNKTRILFK